MTVRVVCPEGHPVLVAAEKLGGPVICPRCFASFLTATPFDSSSRARKEDRKPRRSRDEDDDEDDEDEKPRKKKPVRQKDDEDEKPRQKKPARKDDDEEIENSVAEEDEIQWTKRKRHLKLVGTAMTSYLVAFYAMLALFVLDGIGGILLIVFLVFATFGNNETTMVEYINFLLGVVVVAPAVAVIYISQLIAWFLGVFAPGKSECRGISFAALGLFFAPLLLYAIFFLLKYTVITRDEVARNLEGMVYAIIFICLMGALYCSLIFIGRMAGFMGLTVEKNKPVALGWFVVGGYVGRMAGLIALSTIPGLMPGMIGLLIVAGVSGAAVAAYFFAFNSVRDLLGVVKNTQAGIDKYIKEA